MEPKDEDNDSTISSLMLEEARRALDGQMAVLEAVRGRAGDLVTYGGAAAALFVGVGQAINWATWAGLGAFVVAAVFAAFILAPLGMRYEVPPDEFRRVQKDVENPTQARAALANALRDGFTENRAKIDEFQLFYMLGLAAFLLEVVLLALSLVVN